MSITIKPPPEGQGVLPIFSAAKNHSEEITMSTSQVCEGLIGENTEVTINFDYTPAQRQTLTEPPWNATVEISTITIEGKLPCGDAYKDDIIDYLSQETIDAFEVKCHEYMENQ